MVNRQVRERLDDNALDFISYNAIRSLPYAGCKAPIVVHIEY